MKKKKVKSIEITSGQNIKLEAFWYNEIKKELDVIIPIAKLMDYEIKVHEFEHTNPIGILRESSIDINYGDKWSTGTRISLTFFTTVDNTLFSIILNYSKNGEHKSVKRKIDDMYGNFLLPLMKIRELL